MKITPEGKVPEDAILCDPKYFVPVSFFFFFLFFFCFFFTFTPLEFIYHINADPRSLGGLVYVWVCGGGGKPNYSDHWL